MTPLVPHTPKALNHRVLLAGGNATNRPLNPATIAAELRREEALHPAPHAGVALERIVSKVFPPAGGADRVETFHLSHDVGHHVIEVPEALASPDRVAAFIDTIKEMYGPGIDMRRSVRSDYARPVVFDELQAKGTVGIVIDTHALGASLRAQQDAAPRLDKRKLSPEVGP